MKKQIGEFEKKSTYYIDFKLDVKNEPVHHNKIEYVDHQIKAEKIIEKEIEKSTKYIHNNDISINFTDMINEEIGLSNFGMYDCEFISPFLCEKWRFDSAIIQ